ncbi:uncharacterized protein LOC126890279 [Diabrotica virgifera virgifera]|uniref:Uncharacterized protein n=2 Tax=Diabrotica virgifera virgifera TaxID=50390 RepID=A0ABM5KY25_DIAVI|nr:uncharacterized protein LOC126890279 [Diabrotica virgifera virgifera]
MGSMDSIRKVLMIDFSDSYLEKIKEIIKECQANPATSASEEWLKTEDLATADQYGSHILCRLTKAGSMKQNGDIDKEKMQKDLLEGIDDPKIVDSIVQECEDRVPFTSPEQSAIENFKCVKSEFENY